MLAPVVLAALLGFDPAHADVAADEAGRFHARDAARPAIADCVRASLLGS